MKLGIEKTAMIRARAGISFALTEALDEGHCGLPRDDLLPLAVELLEIPYTIVLDALRLELDAGQVIADQVEGRDCVFLGGLYHAERSIADRLRILSRGPLPWKSIDAEKAIPWVEARTGLALADSQKTAIGAALRSKVMVITGGPGVYPLIAVPIISLSMLSRSGAPSGFSGSHDSADSRSAIRAESSAFFVSSSSRG